MQDATANEAAVLRATLADQFIGSGRERKRDAVELECMTNAHKRAKARFIRRQQIRLGVAARAVKSGRKPVSVSRGKWRKTAERPECESVAVPA